MPPRIISLEEIRGILNASGGTWTEIQHLNMLPVVTIAGAQMISASQTSGLVIKAFLNADTGEIRLFLAKATDVPERNNL